MANKIQLFYHGPGNEDNFCDHDELDYSVECDEDHLYAIHENGEWVGSVCAAHKDAYKREAGIE